MNLPKKFTILNRDFVVKPLHDASKSVYGLCDWEDGIIWISKDIKSDDQRLHTFWHEVIHAVLYATGKSEDHDEEWINQWAGLLAQIEKTRR